MLVVLVFTMPGLGCRRSSCGTLLSAAHRGDAAAVQASLEAGAPTSCTDAERHTALHLAAIGDHKTVAEALVARGAALEPLDADERTPLCEAAKHDAADVAAVLLDHGANVEGHCRGVDFTALHIAAGVDGARVAKVLLDHGAKVNARNVWDQTPMHQAANESVSGTVEVPKLLIAQHAELEIHDNHGFTPLLTASRHGARELVGLLLESGANPNATSNQGFTALDLTEDPGVAEALRAKGGKSGKTGKTGAAAAPRVE